MPFAASLDGHALFCIKKGDIRKHKWEASVAAGE